MKKFFRKLFPSSEKGADFVLIGVILFLVVAGFLFLTSASSDLSKIKFDDSYYFIKNQVYKGLLPGIVGFLVGYFVLYKKWKGIAPILLGLNILFLILVFTPLGYAAKGSHRWIELGPLSFQPSEFLKITFILYLASIFSNPQVKRMHKGWKSYVLFLSVSLVVGLLIFLQPATTMAVIVIGAGSLMYLLSGASFKHIAVTVGAGIVVVGMLAVITPYRLLRIAPFWNDTVGSFIPAFSIKGAAPDRFHLNQSLMAIGTGGFSGVGFGKSTSKYSVLPEPMGDSIFSVIAEEFGFIGSVLVIGLYMVFFWRVTDLVLKNKDEFARLTALGFGGVIMIQTFIHIAANSGLLPFTGVPLPFVSYGGTALAVSLTMVGVLGNISKNTSS